jgi:hypothetical protein
MTKKQDHDLSVRAIQVGGQTATSKSTTSGCATDAPLPPHNLPRVGLLATREVVTSGPSEKLNDVRAPRCEPFQVSPWMLSRVASPDATNFGGARTNRRFVDD